MLLLAAGIAIATMRGWHAGRTYINSYIVVSLPAAPGGCAQAMALAKLLPSSAALAN